MDIPIPDLVFVEILRDQFLAELSHQGIKVFAVIDARTPDIKVAVTFLLPFPRGRFDAAESICTDKQGALAFASAQVQRFFVAREYARAKGRVYQTALKPVLSYQAAAQN